MVKSMPAFTVTGDVIERVTATSAASTPLSVNTRLRITAGLTPQSWAPSSSWITERTAFPVVAKRKNTASRPPTASAMAEASRLPVRIRTPRISIASPPMRRLSAPIG
jgi:hypothetical protein